MVAPVQPFLNVVQAMETTSVEFELIDGALIANNVPVGEYRYFFIDKDGILQASIDSTSENELTMTWMAQSGDDLIDLQPERVVLKTISHVFYLDISSAQVQQIEIENFSAWPLTSQEEDFLRNNLYRNIDFITPENGDVVGSGDSVDFDLVAYYSPHDIERIMLRFAPEGETCQQQYTAPYFNEIGNADRDPLIGSKFTKSWDVSSLPNGEYTVCALMHRNSGLSSEGFRAENLASVNVTVDHTPSKPVMKTIYKGHNPSTWQEIGCSAYTNDTQITIEWEANPESDIAYYWFGTKSNPKHKKVEAGTLYKGNMTPGNNPYWYTVIAVDHAGNESEISDKCGNLILDQDKPAKPTILFPNEGDAFNSQPILNQWSPSTDGGSGVAKYQVAYLYDDLHTFGGSTCLGEEIDGQLLSGCRDVTSSTSRNHQPAAFEQGGVTIWVRAFDHAGNVSDWSDPVHYYFDATKPVSELLSPLSNTVWKTPIAITGSSNDNISIEKVHIDYSLATQNDWQPVVVLENGNDDLPFSWSHAWTPSVEGTYDLRVRAEDEAGNIEGTAYAYNVAYDVTAPQITFTNPVDGSIHNSAVQLRATIQDPNLRHYWLNIKRNGIQIVNQTVLSDSFEDKLLRTLVDDGEYVVTLAARDKAGGGASTGNRSVDVVMTFTIDTVKPAAPAWITSPFITRLADVNRSGNNQGGNIKFAASASDDVASYQYQFVRFHLNGAHAATGTNVIINPSVCSAGVCHWNNVTIEKDQMWIYRLRAIDHAGNQSSWTDWNDLTDAQFSNLKNQSVSYQDFIQKTGAFSEANGYNNGTAGFTIREEVLPISEITNPDLSAGVFVTGNSVVTIEYAAQDTNTDVDAVALYMSADAGANFTQVDTSTNAAGEFIYEFAEDGEYCFYTQAVDIANMGVIDAGVGNTEAAKGCELNVLYDSTLPQSAITGPGVVDPNDQNTIVVSDWDGSVTGTATDVAPGQVAGVELEISRLIAAETAYWNGVEWSSDPTSRVQATSIDDFANWNYAIDTDLSGPLTTGTYTVVSRAYDLAGNKENSATLTIVLDREIPEVKITVNPAEPDGENNWYKTRPTVTLTEGTSYSGIKEIQYSWNSESGPWTTYTSPFQIPAEGAYILYYRAINNADVASETGIKNLRWDQTELTEGPLEVSATPKLSSGPNAKVTWKAATDNVGIARYKVTFDLLDGDADFAVEVGSEVRELSTDRLAEEGKWKITVTAYDGAGHSKSASDEIVVDKTAPAAPVLSLTGTGAGSVDLEWTAIADANDYIIFYGVEDGNYIYAARVGNTTSFTVEGLTAGNYYFVVRAEDAVGNQSANSNQVSSLALAAAAGGGAAQAAGFAPAEEVLGVEDEEAAQAAAAQDNPDAAGQVQGVSTSCEPISNYWWLILILLQLAALLLAEYKLGRRHGKWKWLLYAAAVAVPVFTLRQLVDSSCFSGGFLGFVHGYFYLLTAVVAGLARAAAYLLIDES